MNKQELIDKLASLVGSMEDFKGINAFHNRKYAGLEYALELIKQLDEPQKPVVPGFVAELLDYYRQSPDVDLLALLITFKDWYYSTAKDGDHEEAIDWLVKHPEIYMRAWLFGYEVEKEPLYRVKLGEGYFVEYQGRGALIIPDDNKEIKIFNSKSDAERTAQTIGGTVEEVGKNEI